MFSQKLRKPHKKYVLYFIMRFRSIQREKKNLLICNKKMGSFEPGCSISPKGVFHKPYGRIKTGSMKKGNRTFDINQMQCLKIKQATSLWKIYQKKLEKVKYIDLNSEMICCINLAIDCTKLFNQIIFSILQCLAVRVSHKTQIVKQKEKKCLSNGFAFIMPVEIISVEI